MIIDLSNEVENGEFDLDITVFEDELNNLVEPKPESLY